MKVCLVIDDSLDKPDGVQQYVLTLGKWLNQNGHEVHYITSQTIRTDIPNIHSLSGSIKVRFNKNRLAIPLPAKRAKIRELLALEQFDVIHIQMPYSPFLAGRIIKEAPRTTAIVGTFHVLPFSSFNSFSSRLLGLVSRNTLKRFDHVVSVSSAAQKFAEETYKINSQVVPNAVDSTLLNMGTPLPELKGKYTILFLGRFVERKGCQYLLKALDTLNKQDKLKDAKILICGAGPLEKQFKKYVETHNLGAVVTFTGFLSEEDKPNYLASADIAVFPSTGGESFGIVLIEAIAAGAGVVLGGNNPGYTTVLGDQPIALINPKDITAFAKRLEQLLSDKQLFTQIHEAQKHLLDRYDIKTVGAQIVKVYEQALHQHKSVR